MTRAQRIRLRRLIRRIGSIEDAASKAQLRLLAALRREILAEVGAAAGFRSWQLRNVLATIDAYVTQGRAAAETGLMASLTGAAAVGTEAAAVTLGAVPGLSGISRSLLEQLVDLGRDSLRDVWRELGSTLKRAIRRAVIGIDDPFQAIQRVAAIVRDPKTFASAQARAEVIVRTEVNRVFSAANADQAQQAAEIVGRTGGRVVKWWLTARDSRVRPDHVQAGEDYTREHAIPLGRPFEVGGEELMYPLDPNGSAAQTINCRCVMLQAVVD